MPRKSRFRNFRFFSVIFTKHVVPSFFNPCAGNACRVITLSFLFQSQSPLKNKCGFLIRFLKKKSLNASHTLCCNFSEFRFLYIMLRVMVFPFSFFYATAEKIFFKKFAFVIEIRNFSRNSSTALERHYGFEKTSRHSRLSFSQTVSFLCIYTSVSCMIFLEFLPGSEGFESRLS